MNIMLFILILKLWLKIMNIFLIVYHIASDVRLKAMLFNLVKQKAFMELDAN